jgi:O-antigen ligase
MVSGFAISSFIQRVSSLFAWCTLCALFSLFVSSGAFMLAAFILVVLFIVIAIMLGPHFVAVFWLAGSPTLFGFPNEILRNFPFVTMERLLLLLLMVMVFLQYAFSKRKSQWLPVEVTIVVFLIYAMVSLALHTEIALVRKDGWLWIQFFMPMTSFIVSRRIDWSDRGLKIVLATLTFTGVFVAVIGVLQSRFGINLFTMNYQTVTAGHSARAYGTFSNAHTFVATLFIFLTITLLQYNIYKDAFLRCILIFAMAVIAIGIVLGVSRGPWIGAALAFLIIFVKHPRARPLMLIGGLSALFVGMFLFLLWIDYLDGLINRVTNITTLQGRAAVWATAVNMIANNPLFGLGFGSEVFALHKAEYITGIGSLSAQYAVYLGVPHNQYLHVAVMLGIPGLILFMIILTGMVKLMFQVFKQWDKGDLRRHLALYTGAIFIALMFNSFFSDTYIQDYFWILTFFLAGIAAGGKLDGLAVTSEDKQVRKAYEAPVNG